MARRVGGLTVPAQVRSPALPAIIDPIDQMCTDSHGGSAVQEDEGRVSASRDSEGKPDAAEFG